jgi:tocopherol O-methyltransferase
MVSSPEPISGEDVARHYDQLDRYYREIWGEHVHHGYWKTGRETPEEAARAMVDAVIDRAQIKPGMRVLDVGCGYGATARIVAQECLAEVTGLTISAMQHRRAEESTGAESNPKYILEDWLENRRETGSFDVVVALESTEHMADKQRAVSEMARVLKPGGRVVMVGWLAGDRRTRWQDRHLLEPICRGGRLAALGTAREYGEWISAAGLALEEELDISVQVARTWPAFVWQFGIRMLRRPSYLRLLLGARHNDRVFASTVIRIWLAYKLGALRMVIFTAVKPE